MPKRAAHVPKALTFMSEVKAYLKKKPCATLKEIAESLNTTSPNVNMCFRAGKLKYKGHLKPPNVGSAVLDRRSKTANMLRRHMGPSGGNKVLVMDTVSFISTDVHNNHSNTTRVWWPKDEPGPSKAFLKALEQTKDPPPDYYQVWQAMTSDGLVSPIVIMINNFDTNEYVEECLRKVLVPWLKKKYKLKDLLFWPDLSPCHNSSQVYKFLDASKISYVKKSDNAPKLTHARPIEFCLDECKKKYRSLAYRKKEAKDVEDFIKIYTKINEEVMKKYAKELCAEIPENLMAIKKCYM